MVAFILWYLVLLLLGWLAFPLTQRLLPGLRDRGYAFARILGLLLWGYIFWLLTSLGVFQNDSGGVAAALLLVTALSLFAGYKTGWRSLWDWMKINRRTILSVEAVFLIFFGAWALVRACSPNIVGTEKPMELAFINGILRSPSFPPNDPWLSGYSISYYYFGYVMVAMLIRITGVTSGVGYNLAQALWFALTAIGAYGLVFNLLAAVKERNAQNREKTQEAGAHTLPLLGPLFVLLVSNLEGLLEMLRARSIFWQTDASGNLTSSFFTWLGVQEINVAPVQPFGWIPNRPGGITWWRASRVLQDFAYAGQNTGREVIDEFPFFSYLLGDLHPHVLAMPFVLLAIGLALNFYLGGAGKPVRWGKLFMPVAPASFLLAAVSMGGLGFLNTWDFPIYVALFCAVYVLVRYQESGWNAGLVFEFLAMALVLGISGVVLYLPFYLSFSSQAGGFIPSVIFFTRGVNFWVMFAPLLICVLAFLIYRVVTHHTVRHILTSMAISFGVIAAFWALSFLLAWIATRVPLAASAFLNVQGADGVPIGELLRTAMERRFEAPGTWLTLGLFGGLALAGLRRNREEEQADEVSKSEPDAGRFVLLMVMIGLLLTLTPEFIYLRDQFGWRMNTIFKFYFQAWILWGIAAAVGSGMLLTRLRRTPQMIFAAGMVVVILAGLAYPIWALPERTGNFNPSDGLTLDGTAYLDRYNPDEMAAIRWLDQAPLGVIAEATVGASQYSDYARFATHTGMPTVLGWLGHELQWGRSMDQEIGTRLDDIALLYTTSSWETAQQIIQRYKIRYILIGNLERSSFTVNEAKFQRALQPAFQQGSVVIYEVNPQTTVVQKQ
ncbi:MAG: DUF2298 domain-containing protein [Anaerolineaceae bacterium]